MKPQFEVGDFVIPEIGFHNPIFDYRYQSIGVIGRVYVPVHREIYYEVFPLYSNPYAAPLTPKTSRILTAGYKHYLKSSFDCLADFLTNPTLSNQSKFQNRPNQFGWSTLAVGESKLRAVKTLEEALSSQPFRLCHAKRYVQFDKYNQKNLNSLERLFKLKMTFEKLSRPTLFL